MIARLPRDPVNFRSAVRAALLAAVGFELFKLVASIYLKSVLHSPAGATFGPVLGLMVFAYVTARLLLFATAWAATSTGEPLALADPGRAARRAAGDRVVVHAQAAARRRAQGAAGGDRGSWWAPLVHWAFPDWLAARPD